MNCFRYLACVCLIAFPGLAFADSFLLGRVPNEGGSGSSGGSVARPLVTEQSFELFFFFLGDPATVRHGCIGCSATFPTGFIGTHRFDVASDGESFTRFAELLADSSDQIVMSGISNWRMGVRQEGSAGGSEESLLFAGADLSTWSVDFIELIVIEHDILENTPFGFAETQKFVFEIWGTGIPASETPTFFPVAVPEPASGILLFAAVLFAGAARLVQVRRTR